MNTAQIGSPSRQSEVYEGLDMLAKEIGQLEEVVKSLHGRLMPIRVERAPVPAESSSNRTDDNRQHCALYSRIVESVVDISKIRNVLILLLDEIQI